MESLILAQIYKNTFLTKAKKIELLKKVKVNYCIPDTLPGKQKIKECAGYSSLHYAAQKGNMDDLVVELLELGSDLTKQSTEDKFTPLHLAINSTSIYEKSGKVVKYNLIDILLSKQVELNNTSNPKCKHGISHFHIACIVNHAEAIKFFIEAKVDFEQQINNDADCLPGYTALHCAIKYSSVEAADILIQHGADLHVKNKEGLSCVELLIERLIDTTDMIRMGKRFICTPFEQEIDRLESIIKFILNVKPKDGIFVDDTGLSAFHLASTLKDNSILKDFLEKYVHLNLPIKHCSKLWPGWTPVHFAACCNIETMMLLMQNGDSYLRKNLKGQTALDLCAKRFNTIDIVDIQLLIVTENTFKNIVLTDKCTKLSDLLIIMNHCDKFRDFVQTLKDVNTIVPFNSPIWPGYNLLHLCLSLNEKKKHCKDAKVTFTIPENLDAGLECYNCTEEEEALYDRRIELCLEYGCSVDAKTTNGQTPIHLAFNIFGGKVLKQMLNISKENVADDNDLSHLHIACALGHLHAVKRYLSQGADVNSRTRIGFDWREIRYEMCVDVRGPKNIRVNSTPLHVAVVFGHEGVVKYLLKKNADTCAQDSLGFTPIHLLMDTYFIAHRTLVKLLFNAAPNLQEAVSSVGLSHLHVAVQTGNTEVVDKLIFNGADVNQVINADAKQFPFLDKYAGKMPLLMASGEIIERLLRAGANVYAKDLEGVSVLQHALGSLHSRLSKYLIRMVKEGKCEIESCGMTLLHVACQSCNIEWAKKLIKKGADVNARISDDKGEFQDATPLHVLISKACYSELNQQVVVDFVKLLVENGADSTYEFRGSTPLHLIFTACCGDVNYDHQVDGTEFLLRAGDFLLSSHKSYDVNPADNQGFSYFHFACMRNNVELATKFLDHGVDVNLPTDAFADRNPGFTPLHFAMAHESSAVVCLLSMNGADFNAEDINGNKPLHIAIKADYIDLELFNIMIEIGGADVNAENIYGETLLYCLLGWANLTLEKLVFFLNKGCSINILNATKNDEEGIIGTAMRNAAPSELPFILDKLMKNSEVQNAIQNGFNIIQDIVKIEDTRILQDNGDESRLTIDNYLSAIGMAMNIGCDINGQDSLGKTALHAAVDCGNLDAINALLQLGADINVADNENEYPFSEKIIAFLRQNEYPDVYDIMKALACHTWKMKCIELDMKAAILKCLKSVEERFSLVALLEQSCLDELKKAKETEIYQGLTVRDFLSELGVVAEYPRLGAIRRGIIQKFFENAVGICQEFPEFCGLLAFQYRKALTRLELWQQAKDIIALICPMELPDLCLEAILRYFKNDEMKLLIQIEDELKYLFDFSL